MADKDLPLQRQFLIYSIKAELGNVSQSKIAEVTGFSEKRISIWYNHEDPGRESLKQISKRVHHAKSIKDAEDIQGPEALADAFVDSFDFTCDVENKAISPDAPVPPFAKPFLFRLGYLDTDGNATRKLSDHLGWSEPDDSPSVFNTDELHSDVRETRQAVEQYLPEILQALEALQAGDESQEKVEAPREEIEEQLVLLLGEILQEDVSKEEVPAALMSAYHDVQELKEKIARLEALTNQTPEIGPYIQEADKALQLGDEFSLSAARASVSAATKRLFETRDTQKQALEQTYESLSLLLGISAQIASAQFNHSEAAEIYQQQIDVLVDRFSYSNGSETLQLANDLVTAHVNRGNVLDEMSRYEAAAEDYQVAIEMLVSVSRDFETSGKYSESLAGDLASTYVNLGNSLKKFLRHSAAVDAYDNAITIMNEIIEASRTDGVFSPKLIGTLAAVYMEKSQALDKLSRHSEAIDDYEATIKIITELKKLLMAERSPPKLDRDLAAAHISRGNALSNLARDMDAVKAQNLAIKILTKLSTSMGAEAGCDPAIADVFSAAHTSRGSALNKLNEHEEALESHKKAVDILIAQKSVLEATGRYSLAAANALAGAHVNHGATLFALNRHKLAIGEYGAAIQILAEQSKILSLEYRYSPELYSTLAAAHLNRANALDEFNRPNAARVDYDEAIQILVNLRVILEAEDRYTEAHSNTLSLAYYSCALARARIGDSRGSCGDARQAERVLKELTVSGSRETRELRFEYLELVQGLILKVCRQVDAPLGEPPSA